MSLTKGFAAALLLCTAAFAAHAQWAPTKPVEMLVGVSPGGGIDRTARTIQKIMQDRRVVPTPVNVVNKPGGGSTIVQAYLNSHPGDAHYYEITATSLLTNHITGKTVLGHRDFTPVAMLYDEYLGFAVPADSPIRDGKALIEALRTRAAELPIGIATSAGNTNHIAAGIVAKAAGADVKKLKVVIFSSGGESMTALLGGHVALVVTPSANLIPHVQSGKLRAIAVSAPQRLGGALAVVPTWREQGVDAVVANWRPVIGARGWTPQQTAYWERVFEQVVATPEWQREIERTGGVAHFMKSRELAAYFDAQYAVFRSVLSDLGLAK
ncbi:MAG TPA: tripartite tricarboxylate transporter substrate binding protein [Burkholderiales bacterium]|nr:tripartite tricarboxylate transporter substrate binding protein [Burkholderiales bacterium]